MEPAVPRPDDQGLTKTSKKKVAVGGLLIIFGLICLVLYLYSRPSNSPPTTSQTTTSPATSTSSPKLQLALYATGLANPTAITSTRQAGDSRLFVVERDGFIRIVNQDGRVASVPFLDISSRVLSSSEMGLLGLAFSPNYAKDGNFFVNYIDRAQNTVIARYHLSSDPNKADPTTSQTVLTLKQPYTNHNGGALVFGQDGFLYAALGDGGSAGDPENRAQNLGSLFGKILRLDVSQIPYKIPPTNPFVAQAGKSPEIWDYGLRNPWRISFDRSTHELYIADVGQGDIEEVDVEAASSRGGNNYGWRCYEGTKDFNLTGCLPRDRYIFPALEYDHQEGRCSITGGYVYRGQKYRSLNGKYFYGDFCNGQLYSAERKSGKWQSTLLTKSPYQISTFGEDNLGELYLADFATGSIYQLQVATD